MLKASWPVAHWRRIRFRHGQLKVDKVVDFRLCRSFVTVLFPFCLKFAVAGSFDKCRTTISISGDVVSTISPKVQFDSLSQSTLLPKLNMFNSVNFFQKWVIFVARMSRNVERPFYTVNFVVNRVKFDFVASEYRPLQAAMWRVSLSVGGKVA